MREHKPNIFEWQIRFIQEASVATAMVGLLQALPGTRLFSRFRGEGRMIHNGTRNNVESDLNFVPKLDRQAWSRAIACSSWVC